MTSHVSETRAQKREHLDISEGPQSKRVKVDPTVEKTNKMREIICGDAIEWLKSQKDGSLGNVITGIADMDEVGMSVENYTKFMREFFDLVIKKVEPKGYAIFIQTDRKINGGIFSKSQELEAIAKKNETPLRFRKIVLRRDPGKIDLYRLGYSFMHCFSRKGRVGRPTPDVLPVGTYLHKNATPVEAVECAVKHIQTNYRGTNKVIVDPMVGHGTVCAVANKHGFKSIGIDISKSECEIAKNLEL